MPERSTDRRRPPSWLNTLLLAGILAVVMLIFGNLAGLRIAPTAADQAPPGSPSPTPAGMDHAAHAGGAGGHAMSPVDIAKVPAAPAFARGNQELAARTVNGVREFQLTTRVIQWSILPTVPVGAYAVNDHVPGPLLRLTPRERVRFVIKNDLPEATSIHWHGLQIPNDQDGAASVTQPPIRPGQTYAYEWTVPNTPGTYFYHSHYEADRQQALGLAGAIIIEDPQETKPDVDAVLMLSEWTVTANGNVPSMPMAGMEPNYFTINGKSYPETEALTVRVGQRVRLRFIGAGQFVHPMHLHGQPFTIVATDGNPVPPAARLVKDTLLVSPGERYDVEFVARAPGKWLLHCHIHHHVTNNNVEVDGGGGLTLVINVEPGLSTAGSVPERQPAPEAANSPTRVPAQPTIERAPAVLPTVAAPLPTALPTAPAVIPPAPSPMPDEHQH